MNKCVEQQTAASPHTLTLSALSYNGSFYTCNNKRHRLFSRNVLFPAWPPPRDRTLFFLCENVIFSPLPPWYCRPCLAEFRGDQSTSDFLLLPITSSSFNPHRAPPVVSQYYCTELNRTRCTAEWSVELFSLCIHVFLVFFFFLQ